MQCRACETVCPAQVPYSNLLDNTKNLIRSNFDKDSQIPWWLEFIIQHPSKVKYLYYLIKLYQATGLKTLFRKTFSVLNAIIPRLQGPYLSKNFYPASNQLRGKVALFTGCVNKLLDTPTLRAAIKTLTWYGYDVYLPSTQRCCGAFFQHNGYAEKALALKKQNLQAFAKQPIDAVITVASGCGAELKQYLSIPIIDINQFICEQTIPSNLTISPLKKTDSSPYALHLKKCNKTTVSAHTTLTKNTRTTISIIKCRSMLWSLWIKSIAIFRDSRQACG